MNTALLRDSSAGYLIRLLSHNRALQYPEERADYVVPRRYLLHRASTDADSLKTVVDTPCSDKISRDEEAILEDELPRIEQGERALDREDTKVSSDFKNDEKKAQDDDLEKKEEPTQDIAKPKPDFLVDWYDENDPENPQNWSFGKKCVVTSAIMILTFSVYIGSAI
ncbi:hypothetical protein BT69DRAFT_1347222 [Atractiella rhizophila]|nr:hypothetical protein BT69DRAFT_1347222 [Atractiella rhizophila]